MIYVRLLSDLGNDNVRITVRLLTTDGRIQHYAEIARVDATATPILLHIALDDGWLLSVTAEPIAPGVRTMNPYVFAALTRGFVDTTPGQVQLLGHCLYEEAGASWPWDPVQTPSCRSTITVATVYQARLTQAAAAAPVPTVILNTLGAPVIWTRAAAGTYRGTLLNAFPDARTQVLINAYNSNNGTGVIEWAVLGPNFIELITGFLSADPITGVISEALSDDVLTDTVISVSVQP
jgi:hypothetical protein